MLNFGRGWVGKRGGGEETEGVWVDGGVLMYRSAGEDGSISC